MLRLWLQGLGLREVARLSGTDRKTVRRYVDRARACGLDRDGGDGQLTDELIATVIAGVRPSRPTGKSLPWETIAAEHEQIRAWLGDDRPRCRWPTASRARRCRSTSGGWGCSPTSA